MNDLQTWMHYIPWIWLIPLLVIIVMATLAACMTKCMTGRRGGPWQCARFKPFCFFGSGQDAVTPSVTEPPQHILDRRYARGEITRQQYESMKRTVESHY